MHYPGDEEGDACVNGGGVGVSTLPPVRGDANDVVRAEWGGEDHLQRPAGVTLEDVNVNYFPSTTQ